MKKPAKEIFRLEHEVVTRCGISKERFRKVSGNQWENIIGFNHHDIISCVGEGLNLDCFKNR